MIVRGHPRVIAMRCPCGCGDDILVNIDPNAGPAWSIYAPDKDFNLMTIYPSVWRDTGCSSHFIVWNGHIIGIGRKRNKIEINPALINRVGETLLNSGRHFTEIAVELEENPWSVLWACQELVDRGKAREGFEHGVFLTIRSR